MSRRCDGIFLDVKGTLDWGVWHTDLLSSLSIRGIFHLMGIRRHTAIRSLTLLGATASLLACSTTTYVGNTSKGFWSETPAKYPPNTAYQKATPFLDATWEARCEEVRKNDKWCDQPAIDHMVRKGDYYYVTRTSYPYKAHSAYTKYAVRVHADTGEVTPYEK